MLKKIIIGFAIVIVLIILWTIFASFRAYPPSVTSNFFQTGFLSNITNRITGPLQIGEKQSRAEVSTKELGKFSPFTGKVEILKDTSSVTTDNVLREYVVIRANTNNTKPINISDWSLQSMISNTWIGIPQGTNLYVSGEVNKLSDIYLRPGETAIIATKQSPVGVSFRVNKCSGFLNDTQAFIPPLNTPCMNPRELMSPTINNLKKYGDSCVSFAENLKQCSYVDSNVNGFSTLSKACRNYIQPKLTYNFCSNKYASSTDFYKAKSWRIFLNQDHSLWKDKYEIIRLLDSKQRTVDVFNY